MNKSPQQLADERLLDQLDGWLDQRRPEPMQKGETEVPTSRPVLH